MFNFFNDFIHPITIFNWIWYISDFFLKFYKFQKEFTLIFFQFKERIYRFTKKFFSISFASPFVKFIFRSIKIANTSWNSIINMTNRFKKYICHRNLMGKVLFYISIVYIFITYKISITINKTCKPFKKVWFNWFFNARKNVMQLERSRLFEIFNSATSYSPSLFSIFSRLIKIIAKSRKLIDLNNRMRFKRFNKKNCLIGNGIDFPSPCFSSFISFTFINTSLKLFSL